MTSEQKLNEEANDLWYTLREDYSSTKPLFRYFKKYLDVEVALLQLMSDEKRHDHLTEIGMNIDCGRNIAFSIITAISGCRENFPDELQTQLNTLLAAVVDAFSTPNFPDFWTDLYSAIDDFKRHI